jgi:hypothetical protein
VWAIWCGPRQAELPPLQKQEKGYNSGLSAYPFWNSYRLLSAAIVPEFIDDQFCNPAIPQLLVGYAEPRSSSRGHARLHLDGQGFGESEAKGGFGGQNNLLLSGVGCSRGSRTRAQCCTDERSFATAGKTADEGPAPGAAADEGRGPFPLAVEGAGD